MELSVQRNPTSDVPVDFIALNVIFANVPVPDFPPFAAEKYPRISINPLSNGAVKSGKKDPFSMETTVRSAAG